MITLSLPAAMLGGKGIYGIAGRHRGFCLHVGVRGPNSSPSELFYNGARVVTDAREECSLLLLMNYQREVCYCRAR